MDNKGIGEAERRAIIIPCGQRRIATRLKAILAGDKGHHFPSCLEDAEAETRPGRTLYALRMSDGSNFVSALNLGGTT